MHYTNITITNTNTMNTNTTTGTSTECCDNHRSPSLAGCIRNKHINTIPDAHNEAQPSMRQPSVPKHSRFEPRTSTSTGHNTNTLNNCTRTSTSAGTSTSISTSTSTNLGTSTSINRETSTSSSTSTQLRHALLKKLIHFVNRLL